MPRKRSRKASGPRASWKGQLRIDLISVPVQAFNAVRSGGGEIHFHQLHEECHRRIRHQKVCPVHGEVDNEEIVLGYEYGKDRYIEVEPEEVDKLRTEADRALTIDTFVGPGDVDPVFYDGRNYYLGPDGPEAREAYAVLYAALRHKDRYGVGQVVFFEKEQLVLVRPGPESLVMHMLHHEAEVRSVEQIGYEKPKSTPAKVKLAEQLIDAATEESFDFADYKDRYQQRLKQLIEAKVAGREVVEPEEEEEPQVINLMDALRRSVELAKGKSAAKSVKPRKRSSAKRRGGSRKKRAS